MPSHLSPVIAASARWLLTAFPPAAGPLNDALAEAQALHAVTIAAALRYPTALDAELLDLLGPGGSGLLDAVTGADTHPLWAAEFDWRTQVDETVVSWAACLLADADLAVIAAACTAATHHGAGGTGGAGGGIGGTRRLTVPSPAITVPRRCCGIRTFSTRSRTSTARHWSSSSRRPPPLSREAKPDGVVVA